MIRYVVICFRGDEAYHWEGAHDMSIADAMCNGIALCNLDDYTGHVYDLDMPGLIFDAEETPAEFMQAKCASADAAMAKFIKTRGLALGGGVK